MVISNGFCVLTGIDSLFFLLSLPEFWDNRFILPCLVSGARDGTQGFPVAGQALHTPCSAVIPDPWVFLGLLR